ncbi:hypothetical protein AB0L65_47765 [Nonomuraea sp. NPDC052116]|uniref:hypothetical protein n=1 Tax=Nonomuraea sp. NPDC052116 TaxID=3155665 RepID=UPI003438E52E
MNDMHAFTVSKHPNAIALRDSSNQASSGEAWSAISDTGRSFGDERFTLSQYLNIENTFISVVRLLATTVRARELEVCYPSAWAPLPWWISKFHAGQNLTLPEVEILCRTMLREYRVFSELAYKDRLRIAFGQDMHMHFAVRDSDTAVVSQIEEFGLHVRHSDFADMFEISADSPETLQPVNVEFWHDVKKLGRDRRVDHITIIERWAYGLYGRTFYQVPSSSPQVVERHLSPNSLITALVDVEEFSINPGPNALIDICEYLSVPLDEQPLIWSRGATGVDFKLAVRPFTSFNSLQEMLADQKGKMTFFFDPEDCDEGRQIVGVTPDRDGKIRDIWQV